MKWAREHDDFARGAREVPYHSLRQMRGDTERTREHKQMGGGAAELRYTSIRTAQDYMRWAREHDQMRKGSAHLAYRSMHEMTGGTERRREHRNAQQEFRRVLRDVARDEFVQERQGPRGRDSAASRACRYSYA